MAEHTVAQNETLSSIAEHYGFRSLLTIWDDPANADLRARRGNPHVLAPGDVLVIPEKQPKSLDVEVPSAVKVVVRTSPLRLRLKLGSLYGGAIGGSARLTVAGKTRDVVVDGEGVIDVEIPRSAKTARLAVGTMDLELQIGGLDPADSPSGQAGRLAGMGYDVALDDDGKADPADLAWAIEEFRHDRKLSGGAAADASLASQLTEQFGS